MRTVLRIQLLIAEAYRPNAKRSGPEQAFIKQLLDDKHLSSASFAFDKLESKTNDTHASDVTLSEPDATGQCLTATKFS